jgi:hypothetical protein
VCAWNAEALGQRQRQRQGLYQGTEALERDAGSGAEADACPRERHTYKMHTFEVYAL